MAVKEIVLYARNPEVLRKQSKPVKGINRRVRKLIRDLKDTLEDNGEGIGLAAPQIDVHERVVVVKLGSRDESKEAPDPPLALINPEIVAAERPERDFDGCLSFPGLYAETTRPHYLRVTGLDETGQATEWTFDGFDAVLVHHEIDHLNGVLFIDRLEDPTDLYRIEQDEDGELVRVPVLVSSET